MKVKDGSVSTWVSDPLKDYMENGGYNIMKIPTIWQHVISVENPSYPTLMQPFIYINATTSGASNADKYVMASALWIL